MTGGPAGAAKEVERRDEAIREGEFVSAVQGGREADRVAVGPKRMTREGTPSRMGLWRSV